MEYLGEEKFCESWDEFAERCTIGFPFTCPQRKVCLSMLTMHQRIVELNERITKKTHGGYHVRANDTGKMEFELVGTDGKVHYRRDTLDSIEHLTMR